MKSLRSFRMFSNWMESISTAPHLTTSSPSNAMPTRAEQKATEVVRQQPWEKQKAIMKQILKTSPNSRIEAYKTAFCFWSPKPFAKKFCEEYMTAPFGKHHEQIFNTLLPGDTAKRINILAAAVGNQHTWQLYYHSTQSISKTATKNSAYNPIILFSFSHAHSQSLNHESETSNRK